MEWLGFGQIPIPIASYMLLPIGGESTVLIHLFSKLKDGLDVSELNLFSELGNS